MKLLRILLAFAIGAAAGFAALEIRDMARSLDGIGSVHLFGK